MIPTVPTREQFPPFPIARRTRRRGAAIRSLYRAFAAVALGVLVSLSSGCLSLSMLNHEAPDTKERLDSLERRVSALEAANACRCDPPIVPGAGLQHPSYGPSANIQP